MSIITFVAESALGGVGVYVIGHGGYIAYRFRQKLKPEWREKRFQHFLMKVELPSTCSKFGHEMAEDGSGCIYCFDGLVKIEIDWWDGHNFAHPNGSDDSISLEDPRIVQLIHTNKRRDYTKLGKEVGFVWVDPTVRTNYARYSHYDKGMKDAIQRVKRNSENLDRPYPVVVK